MTQLKKPRSKLALLAENGERHPSLRTEDSRLKLLHGKQSSTNVKFTHYENTYRMEPSKSKFFSGRVAMIINGVLKNELKDKSYDFATFSKLTLALGDRIKEMVKVDLDFPRHKLVSFVTIGQLNRQCVCVASRCMWHPAWDYYASSCYKNKSLFAVGVVFAVYYE